MSRRAEPDAPEGQPQCSDAAKLVYTIDDGATLSSFDPSTKTFTDLGRLACATGSTPFSMGVDRNTIAWVLYRDGTMFRVDIPNQLACTPTAWTAPADLGQFGMGLATETPGTSTDRLFITGAASAPAATTTFASLDTGTMEVTAIGTVDGWPELTGNSNAKLWGWFPSNTSSSTTPRISKLDKTTGAALQTFELPDLREPTLDWAFANWGGDYWVFLLSTLDSTTSRIHQIDGTTGAIKSSTSADGRKIVGAGVSTCAPTVLL